MRTVNVEVFVQPAGQLPLVGPTKVIHGWVAATDHEDEALPEFERVMIVSLIWAGAVLNGYEIEAGVASTFVKVVMVKQPTDRFMIGLSCQLPSV